MEFIIVLLVAGGLAWLWNRVDRLQNEISLLRDMVDELVFPAQAQSQAQSQPPRPAAPSSPPPPAPKSAVAQKIANSSVPVIRSERLEPVALPVQTEPEAQPEPNEPEQEAAIPEGKSFDFEYIFGRLLPIWGGGIALAIAGFFLVRWSIEQGLLNEYVRVGFGFVFGAGLIAAAEGALRLHEKIADERVRQALAGAGIATLYASFYFAGSYYGLIPAWLAFGGLALVTAGAIFLSYRFGLPTAILGLVGGFAAPALAGSSEPNLPVLATYLALVTGGLAYTGEKQGRPWLSLAALAGSLGWGALMLVSAPVAPAAILALGAYLVVIGTLLPSLLGTGPLGTAGRLLACALASLQIAVLVDNSGYSLLAWGMYVLLAAAIAALGWNRRNLREAGCVAALLSVLLLAAWPSPEPIWLAVIATSFAAIFAGAPLLQVWRGEAGAVDWGQLALYPLALIAALCVQLDLPLPQSQHMLLALAAGGLALAPAFGALIAWPTGLNLSPFPTPLAQEQLEAGELPIGPLAATASAALMVLLAGLLATPAWAAPLVSAFVAIGLFALFAKRSDAGLAILQWGIALVGISLLIVTSNWSEAERLFEHGGAPLAGLRWLAGALPFALLVLHPQMRSLSKQAHRIAQAAGVVLAYGALAQLVDYDWCPALIAAATLALAWRMKWRAAHATTLGLGTLMALPIIVPWIGLGLEALVGEPMLAAALPSPVEALRNLAPLLAGWFGSLLIAPRFMQAWRSAGWAIGGLLAAPLVHIAFKQLFAIDDLATFATHGLAERSIWQALLILPGLALIATRQRFAMQARTGGALLGTGLAHFVVFSLLLHNPLWSDQHVGTLPLLNLLLASYGMAIAATVALRGQLGEELAKLRPAMDGAIMLLIALLSLSLLRQAFAGSLLGASDVGTVEDLLRSLLAIALAIGFLLWGSRSKQRSWRIGSLVFMLGAVIKVFAFDAAGLEGLARIGSFFALGICLIGTGWFYSRQFSKE